jgi:hypothetical protein
MLMLMAFFIFAKWWKFMIKNSYIINIYFKISKKLDKVYNVFKDLIKKIQIYFILDFFMC